VGPRTGLDAVERIKISPLLGLELGPLRKSLYRLIHPDPYAVPGEMRRVEHIHCICFLK
jgi:hypothetical protein